MAYLLVLQYLRVLTSCGPFSVPTPAVSDVCVFWCADEMGMVLNRQLHRDGVNKTLHGWWAGTLLPVVPRIPFEQFESTSFELSFYDVTSLKPSVGCGQYRSYIKHGAKSGYSFDQWLAYVNSCADKPPVYPHQCRYADGVNYVQSASNEDLGRIGCKGETFINQCNS